MLPLCLRFVDLGFVVANVDYRLAGVDPAPAALTDVLTAAKWLADHAADYKLEPKQILVAGISAGGELALMAAMLPPQSEFGPKTRIAGVIDFAGIADVVQQIEGPGKRDYAGQWIPPVPDRMDLAKKLSPITYARKEVPPVLIVHGDADETVPYEQSVRLAKALKDAGAKVELITVPGGKHPLTDAQSSAVWPQLLKWLKKNKLI